MHGNPDLALRDVYQRHQGTVRSALRMLGVEPSHIDDAVQDVFAVFHRRAADYDHRRSLGNWLWGIARGVASGYRRSARRRTRLHEALGLERRAAPLHQGAHRLEAHAELDAILAKLDPGACAIFVLAEVEGRTGPEIAERLGMNVNTVYARLRAARLALRREHAEPQRRRWTAAVAAWWSDAWTALPTCSAASLALVLAGGSSDIELRERPMPIETFGDRSPLAVGHDVPTIAPAHFRESQSELEIVLVDDPPPSPRRSRTVEPTRAETIEDERVEPPEPETAGAPLLPEGLQVVSRPTTQMQDSMLAVRADFVGELATLVEAL
jgi:RNA polymerase sigma-70 factor, ECF subfamily